MAEQGLKGERALSQPRKPSAGTALQGRFQHKGPRINWPLFLGGLIVASVALAAFLGPSLAPRDPLAENAIIQVNGEWVIPPFPAITPGFPLGSDQFGRDLFSRLLWALRPTMTMVTVVALVRLLLGIIVGLGAGWSVGIAGQALNGAIGAALSVPVLMVALGAIAAVGVEAGIWAFVIGLSINGWVETARMVREHTRLVKGQLYVEAARALGASDSQVVTRHVVRQIIPLVWMLFSFEISGTLLVTAALGFLGYYVGGDVWVVVDDAAARRLSGAPELGQMLATSWVRADEPWAMIVVGTVVFITVLGFNLLGRGLRGRLRVHEMTRRGPVERVRDILSRRVSEPLGAWLDGRVWQPLGRQSRRKGFYPLLALLLMILAGGLLYWRWQATQQPAREVSASGIKVAQLWSAERRDSYGTLWSQISGPAGAEIAWTFEDASGFAGGPAVTRQGDLYIASKGGTLYSLDATGDIGWQVTLAAGPVGTPALDPAGVIYVADDAGRLSAFSPAGDLEWRFEGGPDDFATSGPVIAADGAAYYMVRGGTVQAVSAAGEGLWQAEVSSNPLFTPPRLSADGRWLFVNNVVLDAQTGAVQTWETSETVDQYLSGADGENYFRSGHAFYRWHISEGTIRTTAETTWNYRQYTVRVEGGPTDAGITPSGLVWMLYSSKYDDTRAVWLNMSGHVVGNVHYPQRQAKAVAVGADDVVYACGPAAGMECIGLQPGNSIPTWRALLPQGSRIGGGALVPGRLYVAMEEGFLYAIGRGDTVQKAGDDTPPPAKVTTPQLGPRAEVVSWTFEYDSGFVSWPVVSPEGNLYIPGDDSTLAAIDPQGDPLWTAQLPAKPVGPPGLGANGTLYQADKAGNLSAFGPDGGLIWRFEPPESTPATVGAVVGPDGVIYYTVGGSVQAVSPAGSGVWQTRAKTFRSYTPLQVSPSGDLLFFAEDVFDTRSGALLELDAPVDVDAYLVGEDGQLYLRAGNTLMQWQRSGANVEILQAAQWNYQGLVSQNSVPSQAGVAPNGVIWLLYTTPYGGSSRMVWLDLEGQILGTVQAPGKFGAAQVVGIRDADNAAFVCGFKLRSASSRTHTIDCVALVPDAEEPVWQMELGKTAEIRGGALVAGRMYLSTAEGLLYAIGD